MEYKDIVKLLSNPDQVTAGLAELDTYNKGLIAERDKAKKDYTDLQTADNKRIADLQEANNILLLKIPGMPQKEEEEVDDRDAYTKLLDHIREDRKGDQK